MDQYIGRLLDNRYEILEIIGTGGMAVVYKARCHRLNRLVAIKILKDEFARDEEFRRRFHAEGEAVAMLSHPNIVQVYDVSTSDNANFIVMELIDGITLKQYMEKKGVLNWKETLHFGMQIAKALEHAHGRSIVHRDIKPHNVMVLKNGSVKVTDFGIARVMSKSNTLTKEALGSVHYISPEQAKGGWVDNRSDLYSLGVVMYEMMAGRPPYDGESPVAVAIQHINGGAAMPSTLNPNIPGGLEQIIMKGMALDPKDRYVSATEMLRDMDEFRKDPTILFVFPSHGVSAETKILKTSAITQEMASAAARQQPRTTAERVAGAAAGNVGVARPMRPAVPQQPVRQRTGELPRAGTPAGQRNTGSLRTNPPAGTRTGTAPVNTASGSRSANAEAARRAAANRKAREEIREEIREEERNRVATIAVVACSAVAILAIVVFLIALVNGALLGGNEKVMVPNFVGEYYDNLNLNAYEGFDIKIASSVYNDTVEEGRVIEQSPDAGTEVVQGTTVWLTVSMGPEPEVKIMSDLVGMDAEKAESYLEGQGMVPEMIEEASDTAEPGKVIRTDPAADTELTEGQTVKVYYSVPKKAIVPDLLGKDYTVAYKMLDNMGFKNIEIEYEESDEEEDRVIDQSIEAGLEVDVTEKIVLTIATTKMAKMINVVGQQYEAAKENLEDLGFTNVVPEEVESNEPAGTVIKQSVARSTEVAVNTQIVLTVSTGPAPTEEPTEEPTETPTEHKPETVTKQVTFELPGDRTEDYMLSLYQNGSPVVEDTVVKTGTTSIAVVLTGSGTQYYDLYINGEYYKTVKVEFSA